jgi:hypothetical protein
VHGRILGRLEVDMVGLGAFGLVYFVVNFAVNVTAVVVGIYVYDRFVRKR